jgi:tetratricopeptide (TPR) repeat protein
MIGRTGPGRIAVMLIVGAVSLVAGPAIAQAPSPPPALQQQPRMPEPPAKLPRAEPRHAHGLDFLFGALKAAPDAESAKAVETRIWAIWSASPSDTAMLLMTRVRTALEHKDTDVAIKLLDAIIRVRPDYVEAWNRRATLYYLKNDYGRSLADIREVLVREPRHFGALAGLGMIMQELGDDKRALEAYRKALAVDPHLERIPDLVKTLSEKVEGRDI